MTGPKKGSRGRGPKKNTAKGRGGATRDNTRPVRERTTARGSEVSTAGEGPKARGTAAGRTARPARDGAARSGGTRNGTSGTGGTRAGAGGRAAPARPPRKALPELKRVQLQTPPENAVFVDRDGERLTFADSALRRVAAQILSERNKAWRYRPFSFPLFTDKGQEQAFFFDFYVYDYEDSVIRLILVLASESREVWDRVGRFKRQYPMYRYELWTPERLWQLQGPRGRLEF